MKRILLFTLLIFFSIFVTEAQFGWGAKGGLTMSRVNLNFDDNLSGDSYAIADLGFKEYESQYHPWSVVLG